MHRSKIEWVDDTWSPITGCLFDCRYCYARRKSARFSGDVRLNMASIQQYRKEGELFILDSPFIAETGGTLNYPFGFRPTFHRYRLDYPAGRKHGCNILVGEWGEVFGPWVPETWIREIMENCERHPEHRYLFLTKNPERYKELHQSGILPKEDNFWYGSTVTCDTDYLPAISATVNTFMCIEPIREAIHIPEPGTRVADWIIIGAESGNGRGKVIPDRQWIDTIAEYAEREGIPLFMKESLRMIMAEGMKKEFPPELLERKMSQKVKERLEGDCCSCKAHMRKNEMIALCARSQRGEQPKQFAHICKSCFRELCGSYGLAVPELKSLKE